MSAANMRETAAPSRHMPCLPLRRSTQSAAAAKKTLHADSLSRMNPSSPIFVWHSSAYFWKNSSASSQGQSHQSDRQAPTVTAVVIFFARRRVARQGRATPARRRGAQHAPPARCFAVTTGVAAPLRAAVVEAAATGLALPAAPPSDAPLRRASSLCTSTSLLPALSRLCASHSVRSSGTFSFFRGASSGMAWPSSSHHQPPTRQGGALHGAATQFAERERGSRRRISHARGPRRRVSWSDALLPLGLAERLGCGHCAPFTVLAFQSLPPLSHSLLGKVRGQAKARQLPSKTGGCRGRRGGRRRARRPRRRRGVARRRGSAGSSGRSRARASGPLSRTVRTGGANTGRAKACVCARTACVSPRSAALPARVALASSAALAGTSWLLAPAARLAPPTA